MTENEAKQNIITYASIEAENLPIGMRKAFDVAIKALGKQIPFKSAKNKHTLGIVKFRCKCGTEYLYKATNYCVNCGQRLDWSEEE